MINVRVYVMPFTMQSDATLAALVRLGHATNLELHHEVQASMPRLTVQSVHRITTRLLGRGQIGLASSDGSVQVLDARADVHDHFVCMSCGGIIDINLPESVIDDIQDQLGRNLVRDGITIRGRCENCVVVQGSAAEGSGRATNRK